MTVYFQTVNMPIHYSGQELRPHWIAQQSGKIGAGVLSFVGSCDVKTDNLVDLEDRQQEDYIRAESMLHFLGEFFHQSLSETIALQRLWIAGVAEILNQQFIDNKSTFYCERKGDDLFVLDQKNNRGKLSVGIVTASPVSTLMHFAINIDAGGAPVQTQDLKTLGIDPERLQRQILKLWEQEYLGLARARCKVFPR